MPRAAVPTVRRLTRAGMLGRRHLYAALLRAAQGEGYGVTALEQWFDAGRPKAQVLILRHDVDQIASSVLPLAQVELRLGIRSTWYFRWRTAEGHVIRWLREHGFEVGLHYETASRLTRERGAPPAPDEARAVLKAEIDAFGERFGPPRSISPHGDTRVPGVRNGDLLRGVDIADFGVEFDSNRVLRRARPEVWLTDRAPWDTPWGGEDPLPLFARRVSPILCVTHPHHWTGGVARTRAALGRQPDRRNLDAPPL